MTTITILEEGDEVQEGDAYWNKWFGWCLIYVKGLTQENRRLRFKDRPLLIRRYETNTTQ